MAMFSMSEDHAILKNFHKEHRSVKIVSPLSSINRYKKS